MMIFDINNYNGNRKQAQNKYEGNTKQIQRKYKPKTKEIQQKYETIIMDPDLAERQRG